MSAPPHPGTNEDEPGGSATSIAPTDGCPLPSSAPPTIARAAGGRTSNTAATTPAAKLPMIDPRLWGIVLPLAVAPTLQRGHATGNRKRPPRSRYIVVAAAFHAHGRRDRLHSAARDQARA